jgi:hypothetical protein
VEKENLPWPAEEKTKPKIQPRNRGGAVALEEKKIRFFLGLGLFFFFVVKNAPPLLAENEGYL